MIQLFYLTLKVKLLDINKMYNIVEVFLLDL